MAAIVSLIVALCMYLTNFSVPLLLYFASALLVGNAGWHVSNFVIGMKLKRRLRSAREGFAERIQSMPGSETLDVLMPANQRDSIQSSITENTTNKLNGKLEC